MRTYHLQREQRLEAPLERVFAFFAEARNLETITPSWLHFRVLNPGRIEMRPGTRINYRLRLYGIGFAWQSEIAVWDPPRRFVDVQTKGPYRLWRHEHRFEAIGFGTLVTDEVVYGLWGPALVQRHFVAPSLERIFDWRAERIAALFPPMNPPSAEPMLE